ncbi:MAG: 2-isopropylmalate synthase, partial [Microbacteriaceae bacterium]|nr:2-isopropylmalate synthase [Microbacteriaceae bacterium]
GGEVTSAEIWEIFQDEYLPAASADDKWGQFELASTRTQSDMSGTVALHTELRVGEQVVSTDTTGNGPIAAFLNVLTEQGVDVKLYDYVEHALSGGGDALAAAYVELNVNGVRLWGVGIDADISTASLKAVVSAVNRAVREESGDRELASV